MLKKENVNGTTTARVYGTKFPILISLFWKEIHFLGEILIQNNVQMKDCGWKDEISFTR
jgi:hypothetical protein